MRFSIVITVISVSAALGLCPSEIAIIVNADQPASVSVGTFYAVSRGVPQSNIIPLRLGRHVVKNISRKDYIERVVVPVREKLEQERFGSVRCLLTTYMMPYKIDAPAVDVDIADVIKVLEKVLANNQRVMLDVAAQLDPDFRMAAPNNVETQLAGVKAVMRKAFLSIKSTPDDQECKKIDDFITVIMPLYGVFITAQMSELEFNKRFEIPADMLAQAVASRQLVEKAANENYSYKQCLESGYYGDYAKVYGVLDLVESLSQSINKLKGIEVASAFDSELALVKMPAYEWYKWQPNALRADLNDRLTLMVSRIDGPGEAVCRNIIRNSIKAERQALSGKVCIDSRYQPGQGAAGYVEYDNSLKKTAKLFNSAGWSVLFEETETLIDEYPPITTAVYCGWYSLNNYVDSFDFCDGAVGYHIASLEARDIRDADNGQWVSSMLADGITATLGAIDEPYLAAFPKPDEFFTNLLDGRCMAEAFALTNPYNSWQIMLIADPLYRPFAAGGK